MSIAVRCTSRSPVGDRCLYNAGHPGAHRNYADNALMCAWDDAPPPLTTAPELNRKIAQGIWDTCEERDELKRECLRSARREEVLHRRLCEHEAAMDEIKLACRSKLGNAVPTTDVHNFALAILEEARSVE